MTEHPYYRPGTPAYRASMATSVALVEAIQGQDLDGIKAICETAEPADFAVLGELFYTQSQLLCGFIGAEPEALIRGLRAGVNDLLARPA